jgi:hypothetical protein
VLVEGRKFTLDHLDRSAIGARGRMGAADRQAPANTNTQQLAHFRLHLFILDPCFGLNSLHRVTTQNDWKNPT